MLIGSSHGSSKSTSLGSRKSCSIMPRTIGLRWSSWSEQPALVHTWWTGLSSKLPQRSVHFHCHIIAQKRLLRERLSAISQRINLFNEHCSCSICTICSWNNTKRQGKRRVSRECNALLNRLLSARMIFSTQMENSLPAIAISSYCMRDYYMIYGVSMHAWFLRSQLRRKDAAVTAWEIKQSAYLLLNLLACLLHTPSRMLHSWLAMQAWIAKWFMKSQCMHDFWSLNCGEKMQQSLHKK